MLTRATRIMLGIGVFAIVAAGLLRFYAYEQVAIAPIDQNSVSTLVGPGATIFDTGSLQEVQVDLTTRAKTVGLPKESEDAGGDIRVWEITTQTTDENGEVRSGSIERIAFHKHSGEAVNCCGAYIEEEPGNRVEVEREGLLVKFPFGTEKKTYDWWDADLGKAVPIEYVDEEEVEGLTTYKFEQTIEPTVVGTREVPASVLGEDGEGNVDAEMTYSNVRTLWVEPRTGVVIKRAEKQHNTIRYDGEDRIVTTSVTTEFDDETVKDNADTYGRLGTMLFLVGTLGPILLLVLGIALVAAVVVMTRRRGAAAHAA